MNFPRSSYKFECLEQSLAADIGSLERDGNTLSGNLLTASPWLVVDEVTVLGS
jgi:hypothetical protein